MSKGKRNKKEKEKDLINVVQLSLEYPLQASSFTSFVKLVSQKLNLTEEQARRDVLAFRKQSKIPKHINYKEELNKKLKELNILKEKALFLGNLNAYLGALKCETELLGLKDAKNEKDLDKKHENHLDEKKAAFLTLLKKEEHSCFS